MHSQCDLLTAGFVLENKPEKVNSDEALLQFLSINTVLFMNIDKKKNI